MRRCTGPCHAYHCIFWDSDGIVEKLWPLKGGWGIWPNRMDTHDHSFIYRHHDHHQMCMYFSLKTQHLSRLRTSICSHAWLDCVCNHELIRMRKAFADTMPYYDSLGPPLEFVAYLLSYENRSSDSNASWKEQCEFRGVLGASVTTKVFLCRNAYASDWLHCSVVTTVRLPVIHESS